MAWRIACYENVAKDRRPVYRNLLYQYTDARSFDTWAEAHRFWVEHYAGRTINTVLHRSGPNEMTQFTPIVQWVIVREPYPRYYLTLPLYDKGDEPS